MHRTAYVDPAFMEDEMGAAFSDTWQYVGPLAKLNNPGDHIVAALGRTSVVVSRDTDGALKGMVNICRHRLHPVALEDGSSKMLQCRYHGWSYRLDGSLLNAPRCRDELQLKKSEHGLLPIAVTTLGPWVFANLDVNAAPLVDLIADCRDFVDQMIDNGRRFTYREQTTTTINGNWKLFVENALECYHCPLIHSETFAKAFQVGNGEYDSRVFANANTQYGPAKLVSESLPEGRSPGGFQFLFLPPNSLVAIDDFAMFVLRVVPTSPTTCDVLSDMYVDESMPADALEEWVSIYYTKTMEEDAGAVELQQHGFTSGAVAYGRLLPQSENALAFFEKWIMTRIDLHGSRSTAS
ncbi:aromatic ring-hydroxylating dioxygenase subunit alpha [Rhodococcus fascians]|nr:aromatic ring-hydroxylating dioxygenase subunit alpha [Rhodococcus fascians]